MGGTDDVTLISAYVNATTQEFVLQWQRALNTSDAYDVVIDPTIQMNVDWATGVQEFQAPMYLLILILSGLSPRLPEQISGGLGNCR